MAAIYLLGSLNTDLVVYLDRFPEKGETLRGHSFRTGNGGKGLNQAIAASKLGGVVHFLGAVGNDAFGKAMSQALADAGIDVSSLQIRKDIASGVALIEVCAGENKIALDLGANETIRPDEVISFLSGAKPGDLFLSQGENNLDALASALSLAKAKGLTTILNPAPASLAMRDLLKNVDILLPNETEAALLSGTKNLGKTAAVLSVPSLVVTLGKDGYYYQDNHGSYTQSAVKVPVVDTTGAGDAFCGSFVAFLAKGTPIKDALRLASLYASLKVTKKGTSSGLASEEEFRSFVKGVDPLLVQLL